MKFLIIKPGLYKKYAGENWTPLGIGYLAAQIRKRGIEVRIVDNSVEKFTDLQLLQIYEEYSPDVVGFSVYTFEAPLAYRIASLIKKSSHYAKIIYGGPHPTFMPKEALDNSGDFVIIGEGEKNTLELLNALENNKDPYDIKGIAYRRNGNLEINPPRQFLETLDEIPFPARDLLPMDKYTDKLRDGTKAISIMTGRGCPFECIFCDSPKLYKRKVRYHSLDYVLKEIKECIELFKIHAFKIVDDTFSLSKERMTTFCERLIDEELDIKWDCLTRVGFVDIDILSKMKEAGCTNIAFGIESGNQQVLRHIKKHITLDQVKQDIKLTKMSGIKVEGLFMIGNIGETKNTIFETLNFAEELDFDYVSFQLATPFPGTEFREIAYQYGEILAKGWEHYLSDEVTFLPYGLTEKELLEMIHFSVWKNYWKNPVNLIKNFDKFIANIIRNPLHFANVSKRIIKHVLFNQKNME